MTVQRQPPDILNPDQQQAVLTTEGPLMVIAGPGSGKTRVIIQRIAHLIKDLEVPPDRIMAVTFTNKAAAELVDRLATAVPAHAARSAQVSTFHRFCGQLNRRYAASVGLNSQYTIYDRDDQLAVVRRAMELTGISPANDGIRAGDVLSSISRAKSLLLSPEAYPDWQEQEHSLFPDPAIEAAASVYPHYQRELEMSGAVDFDDIITRAVRILTESERVRSLVHRQYRYIMVDEYQDTNQAQHELTRLITGPHRNICVVGDPNQSIYGWRNALIRNIVDFPKHWPGAAVVRLGRNYRSTENVVQAAAGLISHNRTRIDNPLSAMGKSGPLIRLATTGNTEDEAFWNVNALNRIVQAGQCPWNECAVIYRTNAQSRPFEELCIQNSIPYRIVGGTRFYQRREVKDLLAYLRVILNAGDSVSLQRIINLPPRSIGAATIERILKFTDAHTLTMMQGVRAAAANTALADRPQLGDRPTAAVSRFVNLMDLFRSAADTHDLARLIDLVIDNTGMEQYLKGDENGQERWENLMELRAAAAAPDYAGAPARDTLAPYLEHASLFTDVDELDQTQDLLTLITLHQAKGLEFEAVALPGLTEGLLPHSRSSDTEEERRLCYVGMTRAKTHLLMSWAETSNQYGRHQPNSPSRFLEELPKDRFTEEYYPE